VFSIGRLLHRLLWKVAQRKALVSAPERTRFDEFVGFCGGHWNSYHSMHLWNRTGNHSKVAARLRTCSLTQRSLSSTSRATTRGSVTCRPEDAGCRLRMSCGDVGHEPVVTDSHESGFKTSHERIPPSPHYAIRQWQELSLGDLTLSRGRHEIRIRGVSRADSHFAEIKSLKLRPVTQHNP